MSDIASATAAVEEAPAPVQVPPTNAGDEAAPGADLQVYDFHKPNRVAGDQLKALSAMHEVLAEELSAWFTAKLRQPVTITKTGLEEQTFTQIVRRLGRPSCGYLYDIHGPGAFTAMIVVDATLAFIAADRMMGGTTDPTIPERALTLLEQRVSRLAIERIREGVESMWREHAEFRMSYSAFESIPDLLTFAEPGEPFLVSSFTADGGDWSAAIHVHVPFALLESTLSGRPGDDRIDPTMPSPEAEAQLIQGHVLRARVTVDARLPAFTVSLGELEDLKPGTVLSTRVTTSTPVEISVCGQKRFTAVAGRKGQELAVRILEPTVGASR